MTFVIDSAAFRNGDEIPHRYIRDGDNVSPPLIWKGAPTGTKSFVLVVEDPDAPSGIFHHWAVFDIPPDRDHLAEGSAADAGLGINDFGNAHYDGPQPPKGHGVHHYHFRLSALDTDSLRLGKTAEISEIQARAQPHVLAQADLVGTYEYR